jgi:hypothetical protein
MVDSQRDMICVGLDLKYWDDVKDDIQKALDGNDGRVYASDFLQKIKDKKIQLWGIHDGILRAVMTTEIIEYLHFKSVRIITVTGRESDAWLDVLIDTVSHWGAENGAQAIEFVGRKGWEKVLSKKGFGNTQIFMTKAII